MNIFNFLRRKKSEKNNKFYNGEADFDGWFLTFINIRKKSIKQNTSNCIGTALYLVGEKEIDEYIWDEQYEILNGISEKKEPEIGFLVGWCSIEGEIYHLGVITKVNPLLITHRDGKDGPLKINEPFRRINAYYNKYSRSKIRFFCPRKLEEFIATSQHL